VGLANAPVASVHTFAGAVASDRARAGPGPAPAVSKPTTLVCSENAVRACTTG
jgi:hypothetical protein